MDQTYTGALVQSVSIENLLQQREAVMERFNRARALLLEANDIATASGIANEAKFRSFPRIFAGPDHNRFTTILDDQSAEAFRARLDAGAWDYLMEESGLFTFMDATARAEWRKKIDECAVPPLTADNIGATFRNLYESRGEMFDRGVIACFKSLSWDYKTNRPFAFGKRIIKRYMLTYGSFRSERMNELADLQRVFCILDGKPEEDHRHSFASRLYQQRTETGSHDDTYMFVRWFKNGNAHITFKRPDLVDQMNRIIARHFPGQLAHDPEAS